MRGHITAEMTVRQPHHQNPSMYAGLKAGNLECTAQPAGSSTGRRVSFRGASVGLNTLLLSASAKQLVWSETFLGAQFPFL